ncbi:MAG: DUF2085 domain-containing protein [Cyanobacteria bacterium P01_D01_bin.50]
MQLTTSNKQLQIKLVSLIADFLLTGMVIGPIAAPFLAVSKLFVLPQIADIIYFMGYHVCPQPYAGVELAPPFIMAVCMRCYGTVMGLFTTRLLYIMDNGKPFYWLHQYGWNGAALTTVLMMAYPLEMAGQILGWWSFHNFVVTPFGFITGLAWGLFTMPIFHGKQS